MHCRNVQFIIDYHRLTGLVFVEISPPLFHTIKNDIVMWSTRIPCALKLPK